MATKRDAVRAAQRQLQTSDPTLLVDGWWGNRTETSYQQAPPSVQAAAVVAVEAAGYTLQSVRLRNVGSQGVWITREKALSLCERAGNAVGVNPTVLEYFLNFEPAVRGSGASIEYNVEARNGSYRGLFQMGAPAWEDARRLVPEIGPFEPNWKDPWLNALAAAAFAKVNMGYAQKLYGFHGPFTPEILYAMHNQGHGFIKSALSGGLGVSPDNQSKRAKPVLARAAAAVRQSAV